MIYQLGDRKPVFKGDYFVADNAAVIGSVVMERNASVWWNVTIRADNDLITLGENVNVQDGSVVHTDGGIQVVLEKNVSVGHLVMLHGCTIRENSLIGIGAIILNKAVIGKNCLIGAGAMVTEGKVIPDGSLVLGVPGKVVRQLTPEEIRTNTWIAEHYVERAQRYRQGLVPLK
jgi:carbonic anhydrase/acetyltransferase-like protein (isoleucine patch superfamily)